MSWSLLWLLFSGVYHYGYSFYIYNQLQTSVSNAAQIASKLTYDQTNTAAYTTAVKNMVVYGDTSASGSAIVPNLTTANVTVSVTLSNTIPMDVTVAISDLTVDTVFQRIKFNKPRVTTVYMGQVTGS